MRLTPILLATALVGCTGNATAGESAGPGGEAEQAPREPAAPQAVTLEMAVLPEIATGGVLFIGFKPGDIEGTWAREGVRPAHFMVVKGVAFSETAKTEAGLYPDLTYFAMVDLNGDDLPTEGELASGPTPVVAGGAGTTFRLQSPWGTAPSEGAASAPPDSVETVQRTLVVDTEIKPPFLKKGRVLVVGLPASADGPFVGPLSREPALVWASDELELTWPVELTATLPITGDMMVLLDLDGGLLPSVGDLASAPATNFAPPAEGAKLAVKLVGPLTELGEGGDSGDGQD